MSGDVKKDKKDKKTFLLLIGIAYVVLFAFMIYRVQQAPGTCPFLSLCGSSATEETAKAEPAALVKAKTAGKKLPTLLELGSTSCTACKMMEPVLEKIKKEYAGVLNVEFIDLNLKENESIGIKYHIEVIPVQIFLDAEGKELWRHRAYLPAKSIVEQWKKLGYDLDALKKGKKAVKGAARE